MVNYHLVGLCLAVAKTLGSVCDISGVQESIAVVMVAV